MRFAILLVVTTSFLNHAFASPAAIKHVEERALASKSCHGDNLFRSFSGTKYSSAASVFCSTFIQPKITSTTTSTSTLNILAAVTVATAVTTISTTTTLSTATITAGTTTITGETITVTASTVTYTHFTSVTVATVTQTQTNTLTDTVTRTTGTSTASTLLPRAVTTPIMLPALIEERAVTTSPGWHTYPSSRLSSACSCILNALPPPTTILSTATVSVTVISTSSITETNSVIATKFAVETITVTATQTITQTDLATSTVAVTSTCSVTATETTTISVTTTTTGPPCPTLAGNLMQNGDWETGTNEGWDIFRYGATDPSVSPEAAETCQFGFKARAQWGGTYFHMFHKVAPVEGKSYTFQGSYKFLTDEDCILKVSAPGVQETNIYNTPAIAGKWQKFTFTRTATVPGSDVSTPGDVWLLIDCDNNSGGPLDIMHLDNWSMVPI